MACGQPDVTSGRRYNALLTQPRKEGWTVYSAWIAEVNWLCCNQLADKSPIVLDFTTEQPSVIRGAVTVRMQLYANAVSGDFLHFTRIHELQNSFPFDALVIHRKEASQPCRQIVFLLSRHIFCF